MFPNFLHFSNFYIKLSNFAVVLFSYLIFSINENTDTYLPRNLPLSWNGFRKIIVFSCKYYLKSKWQQSNNIFAYYCVYFFLWITVNFTFLYPQARLARLPRFTQPWSSFYVETREAARKISSCRWVIATSSKCDKRRPVMESARGLQPITTTKYKNVDEWIYFSDSDWLTCKSPGWFFWTSWRWPDSLDVCCR